MVNFPAISVKFLQETCDKLVLGKHSSKKKQQFLKIYQSFWRMNDVAWQGLKLLSFVARLNHSHLFNVFSCIENHEFLGLLSSRVNSSTFIFDDFVRFSASKAKVQQKKNWTKLTINWTRLSKNWAKNEQKLSRYWAKNWAETERKFSKN